MHRNSAAPIFGHSVLLSWFSCSLASFLLLFLVPSRSMATITPNNWEKCAQQQTCRNGGTCYQEDSGGAEFCVCPDGYGGKKCERLVDAVVVFDAALSAQQLVFLCKVAVLISACAIAAALCGWACCCLKHFNARRLYLSNLALQRENRHLREENQLQSKRSVRMYAALAHAKGMIEAGEDEDGDDQVTRADDSSSPSRWTNLPSAPVTRNGGLALIMPESPQQVFAAPPSGRHRLLLRGLSQMHDELRECIENSNSVVEIMTPDRETASAEDRRSRWWRWAGLIGAARTKQPTMMAVESIEDEEEQAESGEKEPLKRSCTNHHKPK